MWRSSPDDPLYEAGGLGQNPLQASDCESKSARISKNEIRHTFRIAEPKPVPYLVSECAPFGWFIPPYECICGKADLQSAAVRCPVENHILAT